MTRFSVKAAQPVEPTAELSDIKPVISTTDNTADNAANDAAETTTEDDYSTVTLRVPKPDKSNGAPSPKEVRFDMESNQNHEHLC